MSRGKKTLISISKYNQKGTNSQKLASGDPGFLILIHFLGPRAKALDSQVGPGPYFFVPYNYFFKKKIRITNRHIFPFSKKSNIVNSNIK